MKKITSMILALVFAVSLISTASAKTLKIQLTFPKTSYDGQIVKMWTDRVTQLTRGELKFELLSKGEVVGMKETLEAVDKGLVDGGAAWTHYWSNYHPAAMLFGSPVAGGGIGGGLGDCEDLDAWLMTSPPYNGPQSGFDPGNWDNVTTIEYDCTANTFYNPNL